MFYFSFKLPCPCFPNDSFVVPQRGAALISERQKGSLSPLSTAFQPCSGGFSLQLRAFLFIFSLGQPFFCHKLREDPVVITQATFPLKWLGFLDKNCRIGSYATKSTLARSCQGNYGMQLLELVEWMTTSTRLGNSVSLKYAQNSWFT